MPTAVQALCANFPDLTPPATLALRLEALMPSRRLPAGRVLFAQGQSPSAFYLVEDGEIEARFAALDGRMSVLEHVRAPRLFGLAAFISGKPSRYEAAAVSDSRVRVIGAPAYRVLMDDWPGFARALMREFAERFEGNLRLLEAARHLSAAERFGVALRQLADERAGPSDAEGWQALRATQAELAQLAHLSRQTVNQLLRAAQAEGRLRLRYGGLDIRR
ncbi:Crp/Fnr family transcriptional regulator [Roseateles chitinivorans]|uniref:Crp/Fnr family transcriptional regulator n=1 Tax=Roseateles chitinivorans TaxID=2917965 RepID=UPI003D67C87C